MEERLLRYWRRETTAVFEDKTTEVLEERDYCGIGGQRLLRYWRTETTEVLEERLLRHWRIRFMSEWNMYNTPLKGKTIPWYNNTRHHGIYEGIDQLRGRRSRISSKLIFASFYFQVSSR